MPMTISYKDISEIIGLVDASSSCEELVLETDEIKLVVRRRGAGGTAPVAAAPVTTHADAASRPAAAVAASFRPDHESRAALRPAVQPAQGTHVVTSPMVGTFYRAPSPDAQPFVQEGSQVSAGDPLCIIEVMKLFTTINSEFSGTVREIGAENGQPVEFGQMLFVIEAD